MTIALISHINATDSSTTVISHQGQLDHRMIGKLRQALEAAPHVRQLSLQEASLGPRELKKLLPLTHIETLELNATNISAAKTENFVENVLKCLNLKILKISNNPLTNEDCLKLGLVVEGHSSLQKLTLNQTGLTQDKIIILCSHLKAKSPLRSLDVHNNAELTSATVKKIDAFMDKCKKNLTDDEHASALIELFNAIHPKTQFLQINDNLQPSESSAGQATPPTVLKRVPRRPNLVRKTPTTKYKASPKKRPRSPEAIPESHATPDTSIFRSSLKRNTPSTKYDSRSLGNFDITLSDTPQREIKKPRKLP